MIKILTWIFVAIVICIMVVVLIVGRMGQPTQGTPIEAYSNPRKALLVIDTQEDFLSSPGKRMVQDAEADEFARRVNLLQENALQNGFDIVYIRQEFSNPAGIFMSRLFLKGSALKGHPGAQIDHRIHVFGSDIFTKAQGDAFSNPQLSKFLVSQSVSEVYLCGLDGEYCVYSTARGALNRGYRVNICADGILLGKKNHYQSMLKTYVKKGMHLVNNDFTPRS